MTVYEPTVSVLRSETRPHAFRSTSASYLKAENAETVISKQILDIIYQYRLEKVADAHDKWIEGTANFLKVIEKYVKVGSMVHMCLPAFPFKSKNQVTKCLGILPDEAEVAALTRLNSMCEEIGRIWAPGARLLIISDGLVYNDLLTIPDKDVWAYGQELRAMGAKDFRHIEFSRLRDLVTIDLPTQLEEVSYVANATNFRRALLNQFGKDDLDVYKIISEHEDTRLTYQGHARFLASDLRHAFPKSETRGSNRYKSDVKFLAREMIRRGFAFSAAIRKNFPDYLRLSIHHSTGEYKVSLSLLPTKTSYTTPWMCAIAYNLDGTLISAPKADFEGDPKYELVYKDGRPSFFKEVDRIALAQQNTANAIKDADSSMDENEAKTPGACSHCGKTTHTESRCFDKYPHLTPRWIKKRMGLAKSRAKQENHNSDVSSNDISSSEMGGSDVSSSDAAGSYGSGSEASI
ncbi:hypothetical protein MMC25_008214 [Agyrium rufum]|nr:hypothetical protein [Agyrium rufum]